MRTIEYFYETLNGDSYVQTGTITGDPSSPFSLYHSKVEQDKGNKIIPTKGGYSRIMTLLSKANLDKNSPKKT